MTPGVGWFLYVFLIPFWAMFPLMIIGMNATFAVFALYIVGYPIAKVLLARTAWYREGGAGPQDQGPRERWRIRDDELRRLVRLVVVGVQRRVLRGRWKLRGRGCIRELVKKGHSSNSSGSGLLPRQAFGAPAGDGVAVMVVVERPFEAFEHVEDLGKPPPAPMPGRR